MIPESVKMTQMSYVDNSVEIGDFFSENVKNMKMGGGLCPLWLCRF